MLVLSGNRIARLSGGFWGGIAGLGVSCLALGLFFVAFVVFSPGGFRDEGELGFSG
jgi:hypothetical protein